MPTLRTPDGRQLRRAARAAVVLGLTAGAAAACGDGPTAPAAAPVAAAPAQAFVAGPHAVLAPATTVLAMFPVVTPLQRDSTLTYTVQPGGSTVTVPGGRATVHFPAGFVAAPTKFTITRKAGRMLAYDFEPSGTFDKPVTVTISLGAVTAAASALGLRGAYVQDWSQVNLLKGTAKVDEVVPTTVNHRAGTVSLTLSHFSGYILSTGFSGEAPPEES